MSDFDGKKRKQIVQHATHPFGVALAGSYIYWTDWFNKSVFRAPKSGGAIGIEIRHGLRAALDIRSVSQNRQPFDIHPCSIDNGGCSHLCLFKGQSYDCMCPDKADGRSCKISNWKFFSLAPFFEPNFHKFLQQEKIMLCSQRMPSIRILTIRHNRIIRMRNEKIEILQIVKLKSY